jgi:hypothetical protein
MHVAGVIPVAIQSKATRESSMRAPVSGNGFTPSGVISGGGVWNS